MKDKTMKQSRIGISLLRIINTLKPSFPGLIWESIRNWMLRSSRSMTSYKVAGAIIMILLPAILAPMAAFAVSYPAQLYHQEVRHDKFVKGDTLYMFHSGTEDVKKSIHINDTLTVYRTSPSCEVTPIGIIKVISFVGDNYIKGEVFAGEIKPDDIAKKDKVSCLVVSAEACSK